MHLNTGSQFQPNRRKKVKFLQIGFPTSLVGKKKYLCLRFSRCFASIVVTINENYWPSFSRIGDIQFTTTKQSAKFSNFFLIDISTASLNTKFYFGIHLSDDHSKKFDGCLV